MRAWRALVPNAWRSIVRALLGESMKVKWEGGLPGPACKRAFGWEWKFPSPLTAA
jgi:hypothetical protein